MSTKKRSSQLKRNTKTNRSRHKGGFLLFVVVVVFLVAGYFWGTVQIDFVVRKNDQLKYQKQMLQYEINDLRIRDNKQKSYQRIVRLAKKQQMVFLSALKRADLIVDFDDIKPHFGNRLYELQYAGMTLIGVKNRN